MTAWLDDAITVNALDVLLTEQETNLSAFLEAVHPYSEQTPIWGILMLYGKWVVRYCELRKTETETDAWHQSVADLAADPLVSQLVASVMGSAVDRGFKNE